MFILEMNCLGLFCFKDDIAMLSKQSYFRLFIFRKYLLSAIKSLGHFFCFLLGGGVVVKMISLTTVIFVVFS